MESLPRGPVSDRAPIFGWPTKRWAVVAYGVVAPYCGALAWWAMHSAWWGVCVGGGVFLGLRDYRRKVAPQIGLSLAPPKMGSDEWILDKLLLLGAAAAIFLLFVGVLLAGCGAPACGSDAECKGDRICVEGACQDVPTEAAAPVDLGGAAPDLGVARDLASPDLYSADLVACGGAGQPCCFAALGRPLCSVGECMQDTGCGAAVAHWVCVPINDDCGSGNKPCCTADGHFGSTLVARFCMVADRGSGTTNMVATLACYGTSCTDICSVR